MLLFVCFMVIPANPTNQPSIEVPGFPGTDLTVLPPHDVVALKDYVDHYGGFGQTPAEQLNRALGHALGDVLKTLPEQHREFGHAVLLASSECPEDITRSQTGLWVPSLARADHDAGVALWDRLLRDESDEVRYMAWEPLAGGLKAFGDAGFTEYVDEKFAELGLTWRDGIQLLQGYQGAERGEGLVYVDRAEDYDQDRYLQRLREQGRIALFKLVNVTSPGGK
jgi:hypothetical protein